MKNHIGNVVIAAVLALTITGLGSCKKENDPVVLNSKTYTLSSKDVLGVSGTVKFTETSSTVTTIEISLTNAAPGIHPAHIHLNSAVETGAIVIDLNPVDSAGKSTTSVTAKNDGTPINYSQLIEFNGYVNVHQSASNLGTIIAQGDIGGNELVSGTNKTYTLSAANSSGVAGNALFEKRKNGSTLVTLTLSNTIAGDNYPAYIRLGSTTTIGGGPVKRTLNDVNGTTGKSITNVRALDDNTQITYDQWLQYDGYITVENGITTIAQGNIGNNQ